MAATLAESSLKEEWECLCCHQMEQANLSVSVAMPVLGIATSRLADGAVQAMMISHQTGYLHKT